MAINLGMNEANVKKLISRENQDYKDLISATCTDVQSNFVNPMCSVWACPDAVNFFNKDFKTAMDKLNDYITKVYTNAVDSINSAAKGWADQTGGSYGPSSFDDVSNKKIDVSGIKPEIDGSVGINEAEVENVVKGLENAKNKAIGVLKKSCSDVADCGFLGENQEEKLKDAFNRLSKEIEETIEDLNSKFSDLVRKTKEAYGAFGKQVGNAFNSNN